MYTKLICIKEIFIHFLYNISMNFLHIILRIFYCFMFGCLLFLAILLFLCVFVDVLQVSYLCFTSFSDCSSPSCHAFFRFHININKDADCLQSNNNVFSNDLWLVFSTSVLFLQVCFNKTSNIKLRLFVFLIFYLLLFLCKQIKTPDH